MEPTKPEHMKRILGERSGATREHIEEYDRLLAQRMNFNPNIPTSEEQKARLTALNHQIRQLHELLFR